MRNKLFVLLMIFALGLSAQQSSVYTERDRNLKKGLQLYNKQKYGAAQKLFDDILKERAEETSVVKTEAAFFKAACAFYLYHPDTEVLLETFLVDYAESPRVKEAYFLMALFKYRDKKYDEALSWFKQVDSRLLSDSEIVEYNFKYGYCYFLDKEYGKALVLLNKVKPIENKYQVYALYYCAHIAYLQGNYETALTDFNELAKNEKFAKIVPYYVTQIYYTQKKYDKVIEYAPQYVESSSAKRLPEIARIIGEAYYKRDKYEEALPYLETFYEKGKVFTMDDYYTLGYAYYKTGNYEKAGEFFNKVTGGNDTIAQNAYYHLADCYIKKGEKEKARNAFQAAMGYDVDKDVKREAHWSYAKLTYELSYSPFNEAILAFEEFIETYKNSNKLDDAFTFLVQVYLSSKNYKDALASIEKIRKKSSEIKKAYQRVAYFRGLELFNSLEFSPAIEMFNKSLKNGMFDKDIKALCYYWMGEAYYRLKDYDNAEKYYNTFILSPGAIEKSEYKIAHYNLGYTFFKRDNYSEAIIWFRKYETITKENTRLKGDACNRVGDCYFMSRDYDKAISFYLEAIKIDAIDADYAIFQVGFCNGLKRNYDEKIKSMNKLLRTYPKSSYVDDALYELARTYEAQELHDMAIQNYERILREFSTSSYVKKSLLQMGLIYYNMNENEKSATFYKRVIAEHPGTSESKSALEGLKKVYVEMNDPDGYVSYVNSIGGEASVSFSEQDSLTFLSAHDAYMKGDCQTAVRIFKKYIEKFEEGVYILDAHFFKADCDMQSERYPDALRSFEFIIAKNKNEYTESSLLVAAEVNMKMERYAPALKQFEELEKIAELKSNMLSSRIGQLRCQEKLGNNQGVIDVAEKLIVTDKVSEETVREATLAMAKSLEAMGDLEKAESKYRTVALDVKSAEGAEGKYKVCELLFNAKRYEESESEIMDFLNKTSPYQYWLAKSYMLLGDIYVVKEELFQAKQTYKSIVDNYTVADDGIIEAAKKKIQAVENNEFSRDNGKKEDIEIEIDESSEAKELFDSESTDQMDEELDDY